MHERHYLTLAAQFGATINKALAGEGGVRADQPPLDPLKIERYWHQEAPRSRPEFRGLRKHSGRLVRSS